MRRRRICQDRGGAARSAAPPPSASRPPAPRSAVTAAVTMRGRSNSGVRLDGYGRLVQQTILRHQVRDAGPRPGRRAGVGP